jgi:cytochrome c oxidase subunit 2
MPVGVTELSRRIHALHMLILWVCVVIAIAVFGVMIYSIVKFRRSQGAVAANFDHSTRAEIVWTVIPIVILVAMAVPAAATLVRIEDTRNSDLTVQGHRLPVALALQISRSQRRILLVAGAR